MLIILNKKLSAAGHLYKYIYLFTSLVWIMTNLKRLKITMAMTIGKTVNFSTTALCQLVTKKENFSSILVMQKRGYLPSDFGA